MSGRIKPLGMRSAVGESGIACGARCDPATPSEDSADGRRWRELGVLDARGLAVLDEVLERGEASPAHALDLT
jgi:hypothetical protein